MDGIQTEKIGSATSSNPQKPEVNRKPGKMINIDNQHFKSNTSDIECNRKSEVTPVSNRIIPQQYACPPWRGFDEAHHDILLSFTQRALAELQHFTMSHFWRINGRFYQPKTLITNEAKFFKKNPTRPHWTYSSQLHPHGVRACGLCRTTTKLVPLWGISPKTNTIPIPNTLIPQNVTFLITF